jgi:hypothetical protein
MDTVGLSVLKDVLVCSGLPGAAGGLAWFLCGARKGRLRNDRYVRKALLEILGGSLVASFMGYPMAGLFAGSMPIVAASFLTGCCWSGIIQVLRQSITRRVETLLKGKG